MDVGTGGLDLAYEVMRGYEALVILDEEAMQVDALRIRAFPFSREIHDFVASHERVYVVEQNRDAQMLSLLKLDLPAAEITKLRSVRHFNGLPIDARSVTDEIVLQEEI